MDRALCLMVVTLLAVAPLASRERTQSAFRRVAFDASIESGSPDGRLVLHRKESAPGRVYVRDVVTNQERVLIDVAGAVSRFAWSPDSTRLAVTVTTGTPPGDDMRVVTVATGESRTLETAGLVAAWTAGDRIFFEAPVGFGPPGRFLMAVTGGSPARVLWGTQGTPVAITPDGSSLVLGLGRRILLHDLATHFERTITSAVADERAMLVSPDGRLLAFASDQDGAYGLYVTLLDPLPSRHAVRLASLDGLPSRVTGWWTRDGRLAIAAVTYTEQNIFRINVDARTAKPAGPVQRLTLGALEHDDLSVSPDGQRIAYWYGRRNAHGVGVTGAAGGGERRVIDRLDHEAAVRPVAWRSPREVLVIDRSAGAAAFRTLDTDTRQLTTLSPADVGRREFAYVQARQEVLYISGAAGDAANQIKARSLLNGSDRVVAVVDYLQSFVASADGRLIAVARRTGPGPLAASGSEMRLITAGVEPDRLLLAAPRAPLQGASWSPTGRFLLYYDQRNVPLVLDVESLESWPLLTTEADRQIDWSYRNGRWSPDGSFIVLTGDEMRRVPFGQAWEGVTAQAVATLRATRMK